MHYGVQRVKRFILRIYLKRLAENTFHQGAHLGSFVLGLLAQTAWTAFVVQRRHRRIAIGGERAAQAAK